MLWWLDPEFVVSVGCLILLVVREGRFWKDAEGYGIHHANEIR
jgi:hypothetical protein